MMDQTLPHKLDQYLAADAIFRAVYTYTKRRFDAAPHLFGHNFEHARRDTINALAIGQAEGADMHIVLCAAIMHDIGFLYGAHRSQHGEVGAQKLAEYLAEGGIELPPAELERVADCIRTHKGVIHGVEPASLEAKVVADADHLDKYGPVGVYQKILALTEFGLSHSEILDRFETQRELPFFTATAEQLAAPLRAFSKKFGRDLIQAYAPYRTNEISPEQ